MAINTSEGVRFEGCVLSTGTTSMGFGDFDYYAWVWDEESQSPMRITTGSTRFPQDDPVYVDATPETLAKVVAYNKNLPVERIEAVFQDLLGAFRRRATGGCDVVVVKGRLLRKGTTGILVCFTTNDYDVDNHRAKLLVDGKEYDLQIQY